MILSLINYHCIICLYANPQVRVPNLSDDVIVKTLKYAIRYTIWLTYYLTIYIYDSYILSSSVLFHFLRSYESVIVFFDYLWENFQTIREIGAASNKYIICFGNDHDANTEIELRPFTKCYRRECFQRKPMPTTWKHCLCMVKIVNNIGFSVKIKTTIINVGQTPIVLDGKLENWCFVWVWLR